MVSCSFITSLFIHSSTILFTKSLQADHYCYSNGMLQDIPCRFFAVVFDAGSTGTRLHLYKYVHNTNLHGIPFKVDEEVFREVKPGLSSFSHNPSAAASSFRSLLETAQTIVPSFMWRNTPVTLRATAGLRLLPGDLADDILSVVEQEIVKSGFFIGPDAVNIMSGSDEGIYSWFTLNLLLNNLYSEDDMLPSYHPQPFRTVAAFDLGGGSTQLTFWPEDEHMFNLYPEYERDIDFFDYRMRLFTHSFLGNGLLAARLNMLLEPLTNRKDDQKVRSRLDSPCIPPGYEIRNWKYALKDWNIRGSSAYSFSSCYAAARKFVNEGDIMKLSALQGRTIYLFSYFFDRGFNVGIVKENSGGLAKLKDFKGAAETACSRSIQDLDGAHWMPWQCQDLTYIYALLHDGYGFDDSQPLFLAKKLKGMEVSWAQGLSYALVHEFHKIQKKPMIGRMNATVVDQIISYIYSSANIVLSYLNIIS